MDRFLSYDDTSAATRARKHFEATGERTSCYRTHPERETYMVTETYERADGTRYMRRQQVSRWGGVVSEGPWTVTEMVAT